MMKNVMNSFMDSQTWPNVESNGWVQANEGHFWHVKCNKKLKNWASLNLIVFFEILTKNILLSVKKIKCRKLKHVSEYIVLCIENFITMSSFIFF